jgi:hypothetical protein
MLWMTDGTGKSQFLDKKWLKFTWGSDHNDSSAYGSMLCIPLNVKTVWLPFKPPSKRNCLSRWNFDELKNLCQIEHTRHRSAANFVVNLMAGIMTAYCLSDNKPNLSLIGVNLIPQA